MRLSAAIVAVMHDQSFANVTFADDDEQPSAWIVVSRLLEPSAINRRLGMDGVYLEIDSQGSSAYRAATGYTLRGRQLRIKIAPGAFDKLGIDADITIELTAAEYDSKPLRAALAAIFAIEP